MEAEHLVRALLLPYLREERGRVGGGRGLVLLFVTHFCSHGIDPFPRAKPL